MSTTFQLTASSADEHEWQIMRTMYVAVTHPGAIHQNRMVEQTAIPIRRFTETLSEPRHERNMIRVDFRVQRHAGRLIHMMGDLVVAVRHSDKGVCPLTLLTRDLEGDDPRHVSLRGKALQVN